MLEYKGNWVKISRVFLNAINFLLKIMAQMGLKP